MPLIPTNPVFFETPGDFRRWLEANHATEAQVWVGYFKKASGRPSLNWQESVEEALCFGWIDGIRKSIDAESFANRFTPRKRGSNWSRVNLAKMEELIREGRVRPAGLAAYQRRDPAKADAYSFEQRDSATLSPEMTAKFRENPAAWDYFQAQPPGYRRTATWWVISAKREETRWKRLATLVADSAAGRRIGLLRRNEGVG